MSLTFMLLGVAASLLGGLIGGGTRVWYYVLAAVCFLIGLQMTGVLQFTPPAWFESLRQRITTRGLIGGCCWGWFPVWWFHNAPPRCWQ